MLAAAASPALAQSQLDFNLPPGDLGGVLTQIGRVGGQSIAFPAELTRGRASGPIVGRMTVREAVERALAGSGLTVVPGAHDALTIRPAGPTSPARAEGEGSLAAIDVADLVSSTGDQGFLAGNTGTSDRLNIPLKENPRSVVGVTKEVIRAQGLTSILDVARNASNVNILDGAGQGNGIPSYMIRGFDTQNVLVNGRVAPRGVNIPITDVDRVDVIKGPTTDLTGVSLSGGAINVVPKVPGPDPIRQAEVLVGSRAYRTLAFDIGGPVAETENLTYRLTLSGNTADIDRGGDRDPHEGLISPKVRWDDGATVVTAGVRYFDKVTGVPPVTMGNPALNNRPIRISLDKPVGSDRAGNAFRTFNPYIDIEHKFGTFDAADLGSVDLTLRNRSSYTDSNITSAGYIPGPLYTKAGNQFPTVRLLGFNAAQTERQSVIQTDLIAVHALDEYRQTMRFGVDYNSDYLSYMNKIYYSNIRFDIRNPPDSIPLPSRAGTNRKTYTRYDDVGFAFQDKIDLFDRLHILGTVRKDVYSRDTTFSWKKSVSKVDQDPLTYTWGVVYDLTKWVSVYGTMGTGFQPNQGILANGQSAPPLFIDLSEYGLKFNLFDDRVKVTVARFENGYSNVLIYDPALHGNVLGPGSNSHGFEIDFQGQITENLSLIGGFGHTLIKTQGAKPGDAFPGVPPYNGSLFALYTFTDGLAKGFQIGGGLDEAVVSTYSSFGPKIGNSRIPGYITYGAMLGYTVDNISLSLNIKNLFDRYYYAPTQIPLFVPVGDGRRILAQARITF